MGCAPTVTITRQARPNPFIGATFGLRRLDFSQMTIDGMSPQAWIVAGNHDPAALQNDLRSAETQFVQGLTSTAPRSIVGAQARFAIVTRMGAWVRGYYSWAAHDTNIGLNVQLTTLQGAVLDEIWLRCTASHPLFRPTPVQGLRVALHDCGEELGDYLRGRTGRN